MGRRRLLLAGAVAPLLGACAGTDLSRYRGEPLPALASRLGVCAAAYATLSGGRAQLPVVVSGGCGDARAPSADPIFQAASLTKPVVAWGALRLVRAGRLDLHAPVSIYLPRGYTHFQHALRQKPGDPSDLVLPATLAGIPVASLLNHTCGFPNWTSGVLSTRREPGGMPTWSYSGEGYMLLQAVIEAVTGLPITAFMDEQVFGPLGMRDSSLVWQQRFAARAVPGTSAGGAARDPSRFSSPVAAASLYTTAGDYARFMAAWAQDDGLVAQALSQPVQVDRSLGLEWGLGWGIERTDRGANLWQWGNNPGFRAFAMFSAASRDGFVILTNSEQGMALAVPLAQQVLPMEHKVFRFSMVAG